MCERDEVNLERIHPQQQMVPQHAQRLDLALVREQREHPLQCVQQRAQLVRVQERAELGVVVP